MKRLLIVVPLMTLAACASPNHTPIWSPGVPAPKTTFVPEPREVAPLGGGPSAQPPGLIRYESGPKDPSVTSKTPLSRPERRALQQDRQNTNAEIRALQRRERFDGDNVRAVDKRRLRDLKARQKKTLRRLRGG
ncbi:MAG: hypothetical protein GKS00_29620 [Alphaproteobacteria bacterium]|nr:hypothetical protein [Alphaproteobacteria bacterium]